ICCDFITKNSMLCLIAVALQFAVAKTGGTMTLTFETLPERRRRKVFLAGVSAAASVFALSISIGGITPALAGGPGFECLQDDAGTNDGGASTTAETGTACGSTAVSSGEEATAVGHHSHAEGDGSTAVATYSWTSGEDTTAIGVGAEAIGEDATAVGN